MLYRLFTENKNKKKIANIVSFYFESFSLFEGVGYWHSKPEPSLVIEIDIPSTSKEDLETRSHLTCLIRDIKQLNNQEAILVQHIETRSTLA